MIEIGKIQTLAVVNKTEFGVYLGTKEDKVLLPIKQAPENCETGDEIEVFIYRDSKDRLIATTRTPELQLGEIRRLTVKDVGPIGAFMDWGLEKDLFLPFKEQTVKVKTGQSYPVALYTDKSNRLCATMKLYHYLGIKEGVKPHDIVTGTAYEYIDSFGMFVAVEDKFQGLIPKKALFSEVKIGEIVEAHVMRILPDGRLELSLRNKAYLQIDDDAQKVLDVIGEFDGVLPFSDKASPEVIKRELQMSKAAFKRAVGHLMKDGKIEVTEKSIRLK